MKNIDIARAYVKDAGIILDEAEESLKIGKVLIAELKDEIDFNFLGSSRNSVK